MTTLLSLLQEVKDENLPLEKLELFRDKLVHLKTDILRAEAELKKKRAMFLVKNPEQSAIQRKMEWDAGSEGQRLIELQADLRALPAEIDSLQGRIYGMLRLQG